MRHALLGLTEKFEKFLAIKLKQEYDTWPKRLCQRSVDEMVRLQAGQLFGEEGFLTDFFVANATKKYSPSRCLPKPIVLLIVRSCRIQKEGKNVTEQLNPLVKRLTDIKSTLNVHTDNTSCR